jgi:hypothetical protein
MSRSTTIRRKISSPIACTIACSAHRPVSPLHPCMISAPWRRVSASLARPQRRDADQFGSTVGTNLAAAEVALLATIVAHPAFTTTPPQGIVIIGAKPEGSPWPPGPQYSGFAFCSSLAAKSDVSCRKLPFKRKCRISVRLQWQQICRRRALHSGVSFVGLLANRKSRNVHARACT